MCVLKIMTHAAMSFIVLKESCTIRCYTKKQHKIRIFVQLEACVRGRFVELWKAGCSHRRITTRIGNGLLWCFDFGQRWSTFLNLESRFSLVTCKHLSKSTHFKGNNKKKNSTDQTWLQECQHELLVIYFQQSYARHLITSQHCRARLQCSSSSLECFWVTGPIHLCCGIASTWFARFAMTPLHGTVKQL